MTIIHPSTLLRRALLLDLAGSAVFTAAQLAAAPTLARLTQLPQALLFESALFMLAYLALLLGMLRAATLPVWLVRALIIGNAGWALAAMGLAATLAPSAAGLALLGAHAAGVLLFAALQQWGLRQSQPVGAAGVLQAR